MQNNEPILLIGAGYMAIEYAKVLKSLNKTFIVVGRGKNSAEEFEKALGVKVITGGIDQYLDDHPKISSTAIVAASEDQLGISTLQLLKKGVKLILVEKPAGLDFEDIEKVKTIADKNNAKVYVGYNRRFYASVEKAREIISNDGGTLSLFFDFTEAVHKIVPLVRASGVKENWFLQNSTHVIDLAFFLTDTPQDISCFTSGSLPWHHKGAIFSGAGITQKGTLFSYHADWKSAGRWSIEVMTKNHKLIFKPLEKLQVQNLGTFEVSEIKLQDNYDTQFKPGIYNQVQAFLGNKENLCTIDEQVHNLKFYRQILEGKH